jgi:hypothetical protein
MLIGAAAVWLIDTDMRLSDLIAPPADLGATKLPTQWEVDSGGKSG